MGSAVGPEFACPTRSCGAETCLPMHQLWDQDLLAGPSLVLAHCTDRLLLKFFVLRMTS